MPRSITFSFLCPSFLFGTEKNQQPVTASKQRTIGWPTRNFDFPPIFCASFNLFQIRHTIFFLPQNIGKTSQMWELQKFSRGRGVNFETLETFEVAW